MQLGQGVNILLVHSIEVTYVFTSGSGSNMSCCCCLTDDMMPTITCPASYVHKLTTDGSTSIDYTDHTATGADNENATLKVTYDPPTLDVTGSDVGSEFVVTATATDRDGNNASCKFMVVIEGMYDYFAVLIQLMILIHEE